jgi:ABC-2 type transport system permease protein
VNCKQATANLKMKRFKVFVKKEFYHIFRDKRTLFILFGMPIAQVTLFGFAITNEINDARIAIFDQSKDEMTQEIMRRPLSSGYFLLEANLEKESDLEKTFQYSKTKLAVVFEADFQNNFYKNNVAQVQLIADATDPNTASTLLNYAQAIIKTYQLEKIGEMAGGEIKMPVAIQTEIKMLYNSSMKSVYMFVPGVMTVILMLVSAMMTSIAITKEKELGTMEILLVSPLKPALIIVGKVVPYLLLAFINALVILGLGKFMFGMPINGSVALLLAICTLFVITALSLGIFISTKTDSQQVALMFSLMVLMLPTIILSGFIFPIENMPMPLQVISNIIPAKWFIIILKNIMLKGVGWAFIWKETLILVGMTLFFIAMSVRSFKIRLE